MTRTITITKAIMTVKDEAGIERTIEHEFVGSNWTSTKIMKAMRPDSGTVVNLSTYVESRQYRISDEDFIKHAEIL